MSPDAERATGAEQWIALCDELLSGLVHALNNRVTAVSVCAELASLGDEQMMADGVLMTEVKRLQHASTLIGLLPARAQGPEALELRPVVDDAIALHANHPRLRTIACDVAADEAMLPVRVPRWALLRLLLVLIDAAKDAADSAAAARVLIRLAGDERSVSVRVSARGEGGPYARAMAERCGGTLTREGTDLVLTLPSLPALRQRERSSRVER